ncbi:MAG: HIT domain-containing protein [Candidatus Omnitrophota bacterium]
MDKLWAPWRINYIKGKKPKGCIFCLCAKGRGQKSLIFKTRHTLVLLNIFPYNNGHLMVAPIRHVRDMSQLKDEELLDLMRALEKAKRLLGKVLEPEGYNIGINISKAGGAGITGHLHIHIVPRWTGDTNFMPILSDTKIISQSLEELVKRLKHAQSNKD